MSDESATSATVDGMELLERMTTDVAVEYLRGARGVPIAQPQDIVADLRAWAEMQSRKTPDDCRRDLERAYEFYPPR